MVQGQPSGTFNLRQNGAAFVLTYMQYTRIVELNILSGPGGLYEEDSALRSPPLSALVALYVGDNDELPFLLRDPAYYGPEPIPMGPQDHERAAWWVPYM